MGAYRLLFGNRAAFIKVLPKEREYLLYGEALIKLAILPADDLAKEVGKVAHF